MDKQDWPQEPWSAFGKSVDVPRPNRLPGDYSTKRVAQTWSPAVARRIAACVNACAGIPTEELEGLDVGEVVIPDPQWREIMTACLALCEDLDQDLTEPTISAPSWALIGPGMIIDPGAIAERLRELLGAPSPAEDAPEEVPRYIREFPDFPTIEVEIPAGFVDASWHNDVSPHWEDEARGLSLWIDYPDPAIREMGKDWPRYQVFIMGDDGEYLDDPLVATEKWEEVLAALEGFRR